MKKTYIAPVISTVQVEMNSHLMNISTYEKEINPENAGLVKGESSSASSPRYNVWDDDWSAE